jgi:hypothetical protein
MRWVKKGEKFMLSLSNNSTGQLIAQKIAAVLSNLNPLQADWSFVGFDNYGGSIGTPGIDFSIGLTGGY